MHSRVRALHFGPEEEFVRHLGHHYVLAGIDAGDEDVMYSEPGRMIATGSGKAPVFGVFTSGSMPGIRDDVELQKRTAAAAFAGGGWRMSEIAARMTTADDFYMDAISRVTMDRCTRGRIALVGDAAHGNALGGFGTGLALVAAYVLAGELAWAKGDHATAFPAYESAIRDYAAASQTVNAGRLLAPATRVGVVARNLFFTALSVVGPLLTVVDRPATNIDLVDYERVAGVSRSITGPVVAPADLPAP
jgi:2-polyprenyl-6-methoxyphenol hydroxylase-like FAD-dependent oxidoreductase